MGGFVHKYKLLSDVGLAKSVALASVGVNGILLSLDLTWWPLARDADFLIIEGPAIEFDVKDSTGKELLGTDSVAGHRASVDASDPLFLWENPNQQAMMDSLDWWRRFDITGTSTIVGSFFSGMTLFADGGPAIQHHLAMTVQYLEFD